MPLQPHRKQDEVIRNKARFKVIRAGRRSGKTKVKAETMLFKAVSKLIKLSRVFVNRNLIFIAPTQKQARTIVWEEFKARLGNVGEFNESRLEIRLPNEEGGISTIFIGGWENRENYRGMPNVIHIEFDEVDTMKDFFIGWQEIFRPMLIDTGGSAGFGGTPKKENPNLKRLETENKDDPEWASFHFTTFDNPYIEKSEIEKAKLELDNTTYKQEILAEYVENAGALFKYTALVDMFSNTITKSEEKYHIVDVADDGSDKTVSGLWQGLELYDIDLFERLNTEGIIAMIREKNADERVPYSQTAVDAIGVGAGVASSSLLDGIIGFKSSYSAMRTDIDPVRLPNVHYMAHAPLTTEYRNLRSQCVFTLASLVNEHKIAVKISDLRIKEKIIEELSFYQEVSEGDGKRMATHKEDIKELIGRSPDLSDILIMRMYFELRSRLSPDQSEERKMVVDQQANVLDSNTMRQKENSSR